MSSSNALTRVLPIHISGLEVDHRLLSLVSSSTKPPSAFATYFGKGYPGWAERMVNGVDNWSTCGCCCNPEAAAEELREEVVGTEQADTRWGAAEQAVSQGRRK